MNAAVFPDPVGAQPNTSLPCMEREGGGKGNRHISKRLNYDGLVLRYTHMQQER